MSLVFNRARLFDGEKIREGLCSLYLEDGIVKKISSEMACGNSCSEVIDLGGKMIAPGLIDLHCHLRDPGQEWREDIASGAAAGAAGGFTLLVAMPNTDPPVETPSLVKYVLDKGSSPSGARVIPAACVSRKREGTELAELLSLAEAGAVAFTDDGSPVSDSRLLRLSLINIGTTGPLLIEHPEEPSLFHGGQVHEGNLSTLSGLEGIPSSSEEIGVVRGIALVREAGGRIHFTHLSSAAALEQVRRAKKDGLAVSCDVTAHHLTLTEDDVWDSGCDSRYKVNPPLRSLEDQEALWAGIADGTIDAIVTDHAPWHMDEKDLPFQEAPFGIASLECAFAAVWDFHRRHHPEIAEEVLLKKWTSSPAALLPVPWAQRGRVYEGGVADLVILDNNRVREVDCRAWNSKARLTAWEGKAFRGWPVATLREGRFIWKESV